MTQKEFFCDLGFVGSWIIDHWTNIPADIYLCTYFCRIRDESETRHGLLIGVGYRISRYFSDVLGPEDVSLVENVQHGLHSMAYDRGRFFVDPARSYFSEHAVHHLHGLVYAHMQEALGQELNTGLFSGGAWLFISAAQLCRGRLRAIVMRRRGEFFKPCPVLPACVPAISHSCPAWLTSFQGYGQATWTSEGPFQD